MAPFGKVGARFEIRHWHRGSDLLSVPHVSAWEPD